MSEPRIDPLAGLGPNERALLERLPTATLRRLAATVVRTKMRLQFKGWLQYVLPLGPAAALGLLCGLGLLVGLPRVATGFGCAAVGVLAIALFDVVTVKFRLHPPEGRPARREGLGAFDLMRVEALPGCVQQRRDRSAGQVVAADLTIILKTEDLHPALVVGEGGDVLGDLVAHGPAFPRCLLAQRPLIHRLAVEVLSLLAVEERCDFESRTWDARGHGRSRYDSEPAESTGPGPHSQEGRPGNGRDGVGRTLVSTSAANRSRQLPLRERRNGARDARPPESAVPARVPVQVLLVVVRK